MHICNPEKEILEEVWRDSNYQGPGHWGAGGKEAGKSISSSLGLKLEKGQWPH